jgi:hypothetical protein
MISLLQIISIDGFLMLSASYTHAPIKLLYVVALALQILLPKQIMVERMRTGRLPKHVWIGTLVY